MSLITVDIADLKVSADPDAVIVTYALCSCIAVIVYDPVRKAGGMIHYMLPMSETSPEKARERPAMFADTGIPLLFHSMYALGCKKQNLIVKVAGGYRDEYQVVHIDAFCNECGNCATFCPWDGRPYKDKLTVFNRVPSAYQAVPPGDVKLSKDFLDHKVGRTHIKVQTGSQSYRAHRTMR